MSKKIVILIAAPIIAILLYSMSFTVTEREYVIITEFGKIVQVIKQPGLYFKKPGFTNRVNRIDKRTQILNTQIIQLLLGDKNPVIISCYVMWKVADPELFFTRLQNFTVASSKLEAMITSHLGGILGDCNISDILKVSKDISVSSLSDIEKKILEVTNGDTKKEYGIEIEDIGIRRLSYPSQVTDAVCQRMSAEREKEANKFRAEGKEEAMKIRARTDKEATELFSKAYEKSETIKGEGDKIAMKTYADAYSKNREYFKFTKSLEIYTNVLVMNSMLIFSTESGLFSYFNDFGMSNNDKKRESSKIKK